MSSIPNHDRPSVTPDGQPVSLLIDPRPGATIHGVHVRRLDPREDTRGRLTEVFRREWLDIPAPVQWNLVTSRPNVLRGVHAHVTHHDCLVIVAGVMRVGLYDLRRQSPTWRRSELIELAATAPTLIAIPPGVAHGFHFPVETIFVYGVSHYWDPVNDEFGCRWDDPDLRIPWGIVDPELSEHDRAPRSLAALETVVHERLAAAD